MTQTLLFCREAQGRDLIDAQNKLAQALREVDMVKREIIEEQLER